MAWKFHSQELLTIRDMRQMFYKRTLNTSTHAYFIFKTVPGTLKLKRDLLSYGCCFSSADYLHLKQTLTVSKQSRHGLDSRCSFVSILFAAAIPTPVIFKKFLPLVIVVGMGQMAYVCNTKCTFSHTSSLFSNGKLMPQKEESKNHP